MSFAGTTLLWLALAQVPAMREEIVVTAGRDEQPRDQASAALTVLDRDDLAQLPAASLAEVLSFVPGVTMMFDSGASGLPMASFRGFFVGGEVEYVKLLVDGVPAGGAESGNVDWQRFRAADGLALDLTAGDWRTDGFRDDARARGSHGRAALDRLTERTRWRLHGEASAEERRQPGALTREADAEDREQSGPLFRFDGQTTKRARLGARYNELGYVLYDWSGSTVALEYPAPGRALRLEVT